MQKSARRNIRFENCDDTMHFQFVHSAILINGCYCSARWLGLYNTGTGQLQWPSSAPHAVSARTRAQRAHIVRELVCRLEHGARCLLVVIVSVCVQQ